MDVAVAAPVRKASRRAVGSWLLFDWAAQPWFTLVTTFVFGPYFTTRLAADPVSGQALWGYAAAAAGLVIAACSPILGAIADTSGARKPWIAGFSVMIVAGSVGLWFAAPGVEAAIAIALVAFAVGTIGTEFATVFTNAMMPDLVEEHRLGRLSGTGWAVGYVGGLVSLLLMLGFFVGDPETGKTLLGTAPAFGLAPERYEGDRASGLFTAAVVPRVRHPAVSIHAGCPEAHEQSPPRSGRALRSSPRRSEGSAARPMRRAICSPT